MPLEIGSDVISAIKGRISIPDVLAMLGRGRVEPGGNVRCFWPEHPGDDSTPSCSISDDGHLAHCFGCQSAGDVFNVWMALTGMEFKEALRELGDRAGIEVRLSREERVAIEDRRNRRAVLAAALKLAEWCLWNDPGEEARAYLRSMGITEKTARDLHLGWFPGWTTAQKKLAGVGGPAGKAPFTFEQIDEAGLVSAPRDGDGQRFDQLHHCVVFPTFLAGEVTYLKGRRLRDGKAEPKGHRALRRDRVEQPAVYWPRGRPASRAESVLLVEGEKDAAVCHQALVGGTTVVCAMVGASRVEQVTVELGGRRRVLLLTDVDAAGDLARNKLAENLGVSAWVAQIEYGEKEKDPADRLLGCIAEAGDSDSGRTAFAQQLTAAIEAARRFLDVRIDEVVLEAVGDPGGLAEMVREELAPSLAALPDLDRAAWLAEVSKRTGLPRTAVNSAVRAEVDAAKRRDESRREDYERDAQRRKVEDLLEALGQHFVGLYFERAGATGKIAVWSKKRREIVLLDLEKFPRVAGMLAPDLGDVEAWIVGEVPDIPSRVAGKTCMAALQEWASRLHPREGLDVLTEGVHVLPDNSTVLIDGRRMFRFVPDGKGGGEWAKMENPVVIDRFLVQAHPTADSWLPREWDLKVLSRPLKYTPREVIDHLRNMLEQGWKFREEVDCWLHALLPAVLIVSSLWTWRPLVHIRARRRSGKSMLSIGWYSGEMGMPGWVPCSVHTQDVSASGLSGRFSGAGLTLVLDEFERGEQQRYIDEVLRLLRASRSGGAGRLRGTIDQGFKTARVDIACVAASIQPISENDADASRWLVSELDHDPSRQQRPSESMQAYISVLGLDVEEMRRTLLVGLLPHTAALRTAEQALARTKLPDQDLVDSRWLENVLPCLAVAQLVGIDPHQLAKELINGHLEDYREVETDTIGERLARTILFTPWRRDSERGGSYSTTLADEIDASKTHILSLTAAGIWVTQEGDERHLCVNWTSARRTVLIGTEFQDCSEKRLLHIAREMPGWVVSGRRRFDGTERKRFSRFRLQELLGRHELRVVQPDPDDDGAGFGSPPPQEPPAPEQTKML